MNLVIKRTSIRPRDRLTPACGQYRRGTTMIECTVSAMLLVTVISFVTSLAFRIDLVWKDTGHHRSAMNELSNQLEHLTLLAPDDVAAALESLRPSDELSRTLPQPKLTGEVINDDWGQRIVLRLNWDHRHEAKPVELVGWLSAVGGSGAGPHSATAPQADSRQSQDNSSSADVRSEVAE